MRIVTVLVVLMLAAWLLPAAAAEPVCCDEAGEVSAAACDLYCEWNGVNFSHWLYVPFLDRGSDGEG